MRRGALLLTLLLAGCGGPLAAPSPTSRPATLPGTPLLTTLTLAPDAIRARFSAPADGATPLRYELRCTTTATPLTLVADPENTLPISDATGELDFALLPSDPTPLRCALLAWSTRGYGEASAETLVEAAPIPSSSPLPSGTPLPVAAATFTTTALPAFDPAGCGTLPPPPTLVAREPATGTPLIVAAVPGRFVTATLRDGSPLPAPDPLAVITPPLTTPSIRLRVGGAIELRLTSGLLVGASVELYEATVLVDGTLLLDPARRRFVASGPVSSASGSGTITVTLAAPLPTGRYLLLVGGSATTACATYSPERSLLLLEAAGGFAPPPPSPTPTPTATP